jgi:hypothetical protein
MDGGTANGPWFYADFVIFRRERGGSTLTGLSFELSGPVKYNYD